MARVIPFSRNYPSYHPKAGQPTYFVHKIWKSIYDEPDDALYNYDCAIEWTIYKEIHEHVCPKHHTIRAGHRWKEGDWFSPRVWGNDINPKTGKSGPYHSKQIIIGPDIQVKRTWDFEMDILGVCSIAKPGEQQIYTFCYDEDMDERIAKNDGLSPEDWYWWFSRSPDFKKNGGFQGQIICWNDSIEY